MTFGILYKIFLKAATFSISANNLYQLHFNMVQLIKHVYFNHKINLNLHRTMCSPTIRLKLPSTTDAAKYHFIINNSSRCLNHALLCLHVLLSLFIDFTCSYCFILSFISSSLEEIANNKRMNNLAWLPQQF